jgi:hypothetical protein
MRNENEIPTVSEFEMFEMGMMTDDEVVDFFQRLVDFGMIWHLQGSYQRMLRQLVQAELVNLPTKS